jgi:hypothetical protein
VTHPWRGAPNPETVSQTLATFRSILARPRALRYYVLTDGLVILSEFRAFEDALEFLRTVAPLHAICCDEHGCMLAYRSPTGWPSKRCRDAAGRWLAHCLDVAPRIETPAVYTVESWPTPAPEFEI